MVAITRKNNRYCIVIRNGEKRKWLKTVTKKMTIKLTEVETSRAVFRAFNLNLRHVAA